MKITVIGAGFSGLVTAYFLRKKGMDVEIVERRKQAGGLISTLESDYGLIETAANGMINSELVEELFDDLGIILTPTRREARKRYIFRNQARQWPLSLVESLRFAFSFLIRFIFGFKWAFRPKPGETIKEWSQRCFGDYFLDYLLGPALQGIYAGDVKRMSASLIIGGMLNRKRSKKKLSVRGTVAPRKGMGQIISALKEWLEKNRVPIRYETEVAWDPKVKNWKWVIATGAHDAAKIIKGHPASELLQKIEVSPIISVTAFFHPLDAGIKGFGVLFPRDQGVRALGVLFNNEIFEARSDYRSETWIYGGALDHEILEYSDAELISQLLKDRKAVEKGISSPIHYRIQRWPAAIPHYTVQLEKYLNEMPNIENTYLIGNYLGGLGLGKILERSQELSERIYRECQKNIIVRKADNVEERHAHH